MTSILGSKINMMSITTSLLVESTYNECASEITKFYSVYTKLIGKVVIEE